MTALTTILGLVPMALGFGVGAEIQASLARVVIGGLLASTLITLLLIPLVYVSAHRAKAKIGAYAKAQIEAWRSRPGSETSGAFE